MVPRGRDGKADDLASELVMRGKDAGVAQVDEPRRCDEAGDAAKKLEWVEDEVGRALARILELVRDLPGEGQPHAFEAHRRAQQIAAQPFERGTVVLLEHDAGFDVEAVDVRGELLLAVGRFE
jgi:hypothetical protein